MKGFPKCDKLEERSVSDKRKADDQFWVPQALKSDDVIDNKATACFEFTTSFSSFCVPV